MLRTVPWVGPFQRFSRRPYGGGHGLCLGPRRPDVLRGSPAVRGRCADERACELIHGHSSAANAADERQRGGLVSESVSGATELPVADTVDVRSGPEVSEELLAVLPLLGEWHGEGQAAGAGGDHRFGQWIRFSHDGRGFLAYDSRT